MKCIKYSLITILTFLFFTSYSQQQEIIFSHDTVTIGKGDSIFYQIGDSVNGELKYGRLNYYRVIKVQNGHRVQALLYRKNDVLTSERNYSNEKLHGEYKNWDYKGTLIESGHYYYGLADSIWTFYNEYGIIESQGSFLPDSNYLIENFVIHTREMDEWGDIMTIEVGSFHSPPHGKWKFYNSKGHLIKVLEFNKGVIISMKFDDW